MDIRDIKKVYLSKGSRDYTATIYSGIFGYISKPKIDKRKYKSLAGLLENLIEKEIINDYSCDKVKFSNNFPNEERGLTRLVIRVHYKIRVRKVLNNLRCLPSVTGGSCSCC